MVSALGGTRVRAKTAGMSRVGSSRIYGGRRSRRAGATRLMAGERRSRRERGKPDPTDAWAVARATLQEPNLLIAARWAEPRVCGSWSTIAKAW